MNSAVVTDNFSIDLLILVFVLCQLFIDEYSTVGTINRVAFLVTHLIRQLVILVDFEMNIRLVDRRSDCDIKHLSPMSGNQIKIGFIGRERIRDYEYSCINNRDLRTRKDFWKMEESSNYYSKK